MTKKPSEYGRGRSRRTSSACDQEEENVKLLVTGGAGFIGSHFLRYTVVSHPDDELVCLDKLTYAGRYDAIRDLVEAGKVIFYPTDVTDERGVFDVFDREKPDVVVHFAAETHVDRAIADPGVFVATNVLGTQVMLEASKTFGVRRFHQVSTDEVYGSLKREGTDLFTEESGLRPSSPYAASKAAADLLVLSYAKTYGLPVTITRSSNNYGPGQHPEKLIPLAIRCAEEESPVPLYGDGKNVRDWLFVKDHCAAIDAVLKRGKTGEVYNVCSGEERTNEQVLQEVFRLMKKGSYRFVKDRPGHDERYTMSHDKITEQTFWTPRTTFFAGLQATIRAH